MKSLLKSFKYFFNSKRFNPKKYWEGRAQKYGARSVVNLQHTDDQLKEMTKTQINKLFPLLQNELQGNEKVILDYGCGPGRFTGKLAELIDGTAIGVDLIEYLLKIAPENEKVIYRKIENQVIPVENKSIDIIWICLVMGGIVNKNILKKSIVELSRVAKDNALIFLIENTSKRENRVHWKFRSEEEYLKLFKEFNIRCVDGYYDLDEKISIFSGRKNG